LNIQEQLLAACNQVKGKKGHQKRGVLSDIVEILVGMKTMVTHNIMTDLELANGAQGEIVDIVLDK
jgi:hypothetical protein